MREREELRLKMDSFRPLGEIVYEALRDAILNEALKPGERLMEADLAEELGVSRTPVREAIRKLELDGFVVMVPRKGAYVAGLSIKDIHEVFEIRGTLEALAAGLAASRASKEEIEEMERSFVLEVGSWETTDLMKIIEADTKFHEILYKAARNKRLQEMLLDLREHVHRFRTTTLAVPGRLKFALEEHCRIVEAISDRNVELARKRAREHVESAENAMLSLISYQK